MRTRSLPFLLAAMIAPVTLGQTTSDTAASSVVGYLEIPCPGGSDTVVGIPFERPADYRGRLGALTPGSESVITLADGDPGFGENALVGGHFLRFTSGPAAGRQYPVVANIGAEIRVVVPEGHPPLDAQPGDGVDLVPHWTPATLFPPASQTALHPSGGLLPNQRGSELLVYPSGPVAENASPERVYFLTSGGSWREVATDLPPAADAALPPHAVLVIRHPAGATDTVFQPASLVNATPSGVPLNSRRGAPLDHFIALHHPTTTVLSQHTGLERGLTPSPGLNPAQRRDLLLVFDNAGAAHDREPGATYFRHHGDWYEAVGNGQPPRLANDATLTPGAAIVIRKAATLTPQVTVWTQDPNL